MKSPVLTVDSLLQKNVSWDFFHSGQQKQGFIMVSSQQHVLRVFTKQEDLRL